MAQTSPEFKTNLKIKIDRTIEALERNNMAGYYAADTNELFRTVESLIVNDKMITAGGSMTLVETGLLELFRTKYKDIFIDREAASGGEWQNVARQGFSADTFFSGTNAITESGELYNIDGIGSRVSAQIFGPKQVIIVTGANKIVPNIEAAMSRLENVAAPCNAARMGRETPCTSEGSCRKCIHDERICCSYVIIRRQIIRDRIKVIFLPESYGY